MQHALSHKRLPGLMVAGHEAHGIVEGADDNMSFQRQRWMELVFGHGQHSLPIKLLPRASP
jgi:hypothetical protein